VASRHQRQRYHDFLLPLQPKRTRGRMRSKRK